MSGFFSSLMTMLLTVYMTFGGTAAASAAPEEAATEFLKGVSAGTPSVTEQYVDNDYMNLLVNCTGDADVVADMNAVLFKNFSYRITDSAARGNVAVVQLQIKTDDFSKVLDTYENDSYEFVSENLYDDVVTDKEKLSAKCLEIYVEDLKKTAGDDPDLETVLYLPMKSDGYGNWDILLNDKIMKTLLGGLQLPVEE